MAFVASMLAVLSLALASSAHAAADISVGDSCKVSANWTINGSVNFDNTSGSPSRGYADYAVMTSPGPLSVTYSTITYYDWTGREVHGPALWTRQGSGTNPYTYRIDPNLSGIHQVRIDPEANGPTGPYCTGYSDLMIINSKN